LPKNQKITSLEQNYNILFDCEATKRIHTNSAVVEYSILWQHEIDIDSAARISEVFVIMTVIIDVAASLMT